MFIDAIRSKFRHALNRFWPRHSVVLPETVGERPKRKPRYMRVRSRDLPQLLSLALEKGDTETIQGITERCARTKVPHAVAVGVASKLVSWAKTDEAWQIIADMNHAEDPVRFSALCQRIMKGTQDKEIEAKAARILNEVLNVHTGSSLQYSEQDKPEPGERSRYQFVSEPTDKQSAAGTLDILHFEGLAPEHRTINVELWKKMEGRVANKRRPTVTVYRDVFVNSLGQMWRENGEILRNAHRPLEDMTTTPPYAEVDTAILSTNATKGFYHWFAEHLPALSWHLYAPDLKATVLFGEHSRSFQEETLDLLSPFRPQSLKIPGAVRCAECYVPHISIDRLAQWSYFARTYDLIRENSARIAHHIRPFDAIYISRRDSDRRVMANEVELETRLQAHGVKICLFSEMSLAEQVQQVQFAKMVIAPHGAGLTHLIAAKPGLRVVELMPSQIGSHNLRFNFARLSQARGHHHTMWLEAVDPVSQGWTVDIDPLMHLLEQNLTEL